MYMFIIIAYVNIVRLKRSRWKWLFVRSRTGRGEARVCAVTAVNSLSFKGGVRVQRGYFPTHHQNHPAPGEQAALCNRPSWSHWADTILPTASHTPPILPYYAKAARAGIPQGAKGHQSPGCCRGLGLLWRENQKSLLRETQVHAGSPAFRLWAPLSIFKWLPLNHFFKPNCYLCFSHYQCQK